MEIQLGALTQLLGGELTDASMAEAMVDNVQPLDRAGARDLAFLWDPNLVDAAKASQAACIVSKEAIEGKCCLLVADPQQAMLFLLGQVYALRHPAPKAGVHPSAFVDPSAQLGEGVSVGANATVDSGAKVGARSQIRPNAYVGRGARIGADCVIHPNATLLDHVVLGDGCVVWSGAVIGKDGFGFVPRSGDRRDLSQGSVRIPQVGGVKIGDGVEVGALTTVDRGALDDTKVGKGVVIDSQVHIAHGCDVGEHSIVIGRTALAGGVKIGKETYLLQGSAVGQGRTVGEKAIIGSGAQVLFHDVEGGGEVQGWPARPVMQERRLQVIFKKLPEELRDLKRRVKDLERGEGHGR